jgi:hypothetical protein
MILAAAILWQSGPAPMESGPAAAREMRYERALVVPPGASGTACAVLDAEVFAHAASRSADDLRVFSEANGIETEVPFALGESEAQPDEVAFAKASNVTIKAGMVEFDLAMPARAYTTVLLDVAAKDFVGTATVTEQAGGTAVAKAMGRFAVFDLSSRGLGRSTELGLQESSVPTIHVELKLRGLGGGAFAGATAAMVRGARVPPSREAQTLYTTVAETSEFGQSEGRSVAILQVPAHVPVERVAFAMSARVVRNFQREVTVTARPDGMPNRAMVETVAGTISDVHLSVAVDPNGAEAEYRNMVVDSTLAATLRSGAAVEIAISNGEDGPLPIKNVKLQMRQRTVCFAMDAGAKYMLRYGDEELRAPVYSAVAQMDAGAAAPIVAMLGPERVNGSYAARVEVKSYRGRHPELLWIGLLAIVTALGAAGMHGSKQKGRRS